MARGVGSPVASRPFRLADADVEALGEGRALVVDGALDGTASAAVWRAAVAAVARGEVASAGVGRAAGYRVDTAIRSDLMCWLGDEDIAGPFAPAARLFDAVMAEANAQVWLGLRRWTAQLALYPGAGTRYQRHLDAFVRHPGRLLTAILYLNPAWTPADGGALAVFEPSGERFVEPLLGRLVVFLSDRVEHEVRPVHAPRLALTAWYSGDV